MADHENSGGAPNAEGENLPKNSGAFRRWLDSAMRHMGWVRSHELQKAHRLVADQKTLRLVAERHKAEIADLKSRLAEAVTLNTQLLKAMRTVDKNKEDVQRSVRVFGDQLQSVSVYIKKIHDETASRLGADQALLDRTRAREIFLNEAIRDSDWRAAERIGALRMALSAARAQSAGRPIMMDAHAFAGELARLAGDEQVSRDASALELGFREGAFSLARICVDDLLVLARPKGERVALIGAPDSTAALRERLESVDAYIPAQIIEVAQPGLGTTKDAGVVIATTSFAAASDPLTWLRTLSSCLAPGGRLVLAENLNGKQPSLDPENTFMGLDAIAGLFSDWTVDWLSLAGAGSEFGLEIHDAVSAKLILSQIDKRAALLKMNAVLTAPFSPADVLRSTKEPQRRLEPNAEREESRQPRTTTSDERPAWVFVLPKGARGWILEGIAKEIARHTEGKCLFVDFPAPLPEADRYFFMHYLNYFDQCETQPELFSRSCYVWYTHPRTAEMDIENVAANLASAAHIFPTCREWRERLTAAGLAPERSSVVIGGADPDLFKGKTRHGNGAIGLSSMYYPRKQPDLILDVVRAMPNREFLLLGRGWEQFHRMDALMACSNFQYLSPSYTEYPALYQKMDVFLSASTLEGGPIPLIEAMMSNLVPVASRTGFAPDIIDHARNGFIFDADANAEDVVELLDAAFALDTDIREDALAYSWEIFAKRVIEICVSEATQFGDGP